jgi:hypothetical protein
MTKYAAYGTTFGVTGGTVIAQVKSVSGPGIKLDTVDVTTHDSTGGWEEVVGTILRSGEVKLNWNMTRRRRPTRTPQMGLLPL